MKLLFPKITLIILVFFISIHLNAQKDFQGKAYYFSKTPMELGRFGARMNEQQKKQMEARLKNRLEKTYILTFNKEESLYKEDEKLDAISGATDSWGQNFTPGTQYKNVKTNSFSQEQEFYGKQFLVKDDLQPLEWKMGTETKQIGNYTCFKATCTRPVFDISWYVFSWERNRNENKKQPDSTETVSSQLKTKEEPVEMVDIEAWYTPMIPVNQGPADYWGLPGLILEVSYGNTTLLCSKIVMNPQEKTKIEEPSRGKEVTKEAYYKIITEKMQEFRENRGGRQRRR